MLHFLSTLCPIVTDEAARHEIRIAAIIFGFKKINSIQLWAFALGVKDILKKDGDSNPIGGAEGR